MPYLENNGLRLHYEAHGEGEPVILLHGATVNFELNYGACGWIEKLTAEGLQVIGLDFRGHGKSEKPHDVAAYGTAQLASDVLALVDHLNLDRPALIGYSIGTAVALHLLESAPARFCAGALVATGDGLVGVPPFTFDVVAPALGRVLARAEFPSDLPAHVSAYWTFVERTGGDREALLAFSRASYPSSTLERAEAVEHPVIVVSGDKDLVLGRGPKLAEALGNGTYLEVAGDHFSLAIDAKVQIAVARFVAGAAEK